MVRCVSSKIMYSWLFKVCAWVVSIGRASDSSIRSYGVSCQSSIHVNVDNLMHSGLLKRAVSLFNPSLRIYIHSALANGGKEPRGIRGYSITGANTTFTSWKLQGNQVPLCTINTWQRMAKFTPIRVERQMRLIHSEVISMKGDYMQKELVLIYQDFQTPFGLVLALLQMGLLVLASISIGPLSIWWKFNCLSLVT